MTQQIPPSENKNNLGCIPYVLGGCSFIPLFGVPFGIAAIIWGVITFRKGGWKPAVVGLCGVLSTFIVYLCTFYFGFVWGGPYDAMRAKTAKENLTGLVKRIEFYKVTRGQYPESLEEMSMGASNQERLLMMDPTAISAFTTDKMPGRHIYFYYKLEPDKKHYYLLSPGADRKLSTADDIKPDLAETERKSTGLLIQK